MVVNFTEQNNSSNAAHYVTMTDANVREWKKVEVKYISLIRKVFYVLTSGNARRDERNCP
jgi:hypothetical protein